MKKYTALENERVKYLEGLYWSGKASLQDEQELKQLLALHNTIGSDEIRVLLISTSQYADKTLDSDFDERFWGKVRDEKPAPRNAFSVAHFMRYAAIGIIAVGISFALWSILATSLGNGKNVDAVVSQNDTYDTPEAAFEEVKNALMFASKNLNKAKQPVTEIKRFHEAEVSIMGIPGNNNVPNTTNREESK